MSSLTVGSQYRFRATLTKDGMVWDLTGATITLNFKKPDGSTSTRSASLLVASSGQVYYDSTVADLDQAGEWRRSWKVNLGGIISLTVPVRFTVVESP